MIESHRALGKPPYPSLPIEHVITYPVAKRMAVTEKSLASNTLFRPIPATGNALPPSVRGRNKDGTPSSN